MGSWAGDEDRMTTADDMRAWMARTIWWQGRLELLRHAGRSQQPQPPAVDSPDAVVEPARSTVFPRRAPVVEA